MTFIEWWKDQGQYFKAANYLDAKRMAKEAYESALSWKHDSTPIAFAQVLENGDLRISGNGLRMLSDKLDDSIAMQPLYLCPPNMQWQPIETAPHGKAVLAFYKTSFGKGRIIRAQYIEKYTEESGEASIDCGFYDYCEETNEYYTPEGWYELIDNGHEYSSYFLEASNKPTHWHPLPPSPKEQQQ